MSDNLRKCRPTLYESAYVCICRPLYAYEYVSVRLHNVENHKTELHEIFMHVTAVSVARFS